MVARLPDKGTDEVCTEILSAVVIEIHRQKSNIRSHICIAEPFIEFNAIENRDLFFPEDMFQPKVSMTVSDSVRSDPMVENVLLCSKKIVRPVLHPFIHFPGNRHVDIFLGLFEVFIGILSHAFRFGKTLNEITGLRGKIEFL